MAQQGSIPMDWQIYKGRANYTWFIIICVFACPLAFCEISEILNPYANGWAKLTFGIPLAILGIIALIAYSWARECKKSLFVITPDRVVTISHRQTAWLSFRDIKSIEIGHRWQTGGNDAAVYTTHTYWLDVYGKDGSYMPWHIRPEFGDQEYMCKHVIAAYRMR